MILADLLLGARQWLGVAIALAAVALILVVWAYWRAGSQIWVRVLAGLLKAAGIALLAICLVEPLFTGTRPRPGSNLLLVVADNSRSLQLADRGSRQTRGQIFQACLEEKSPWLTRVAQDFDLRRYTFDTTLRPVKDFAELPYDGQASALQGSLTALAERFQGQPIAGILLLTDGNATDLSSQLDWSQLPPVYPVVPGRGTELVDLSVARVSISQTNFEAAPVTVTAEKLADGVYYLKGGSHHSVAIEQADHVVVVEAPLDEARSSAVIAKVKETIPGKPIRSIVNSHVHFDHSGGLRTYVAEGATVVTHEMNRPYYEKAWAAPRTLNPDSLARAARPAAFDTFAEKHVLTDGRRLPVSRAGYQRLSSLL